MANRAHVHHGKYTACRLAVASQAVPKWPVLALLTVGGDEALSFRLLQAPPDPILGLNEQFKADKSPNKLNLGVGAYRTEAGDPLVLNVVRKAELKIVTNPSSTKEYLGITGLPDFCKLSQKLAFGDVPAVGEGRIVTSQALSGTGSLRVGAEFLAKFWPVKTIYISQPTWGNHNKIFPSGGIAIKPYRYFSPVTKVRANLQICKFKLASLCTVIALQDQLLQLFMGSFSFYLIWSCRTCCACCDPCCDPSCFWGPFD